MATSHSRQSRAEGGWRGGGGAIPIHGSKQSVVEKRLSKKQWIAGDEQVLEAGGVFLD